MVLGQVDYFIQCVVVGSQITLDNIQPCDTSTPWQSQIPVIRRLDKTLIIRMCL